MTLRATIEIVPFGDEENKKELFRLDISNIELVRREGFGNDYCKYRVDVYGRILDFFKPEKGKEWEHIHTDFIEEHNRRDGAIALVQKACDLVQEKV